MKWFLLVALWVMAAGNISGCGEDDQANGELKELKARCVGNYCEVIKECVPSKPKEYEDCISSCDAFDKAESAEEYKGEFLCREECIENATTFLAKCYCFVSKEEGGPDC